MLLHLKHLLVSSGQQYRYTLSLFHMIYFKNLQSVSWQKRQHYKCISKFTHYQCICPTSPVKTTCGIHITLVCVIANTHTHTTHTYTYNTHIPTTHIYTYNTHIYIQHTYIHTTHTYTYTNTSGNNILLCSDCA